MFQYTKIGPGCLIPIIEMHQNAHFKGVIVIGKDSTIKLDKNTDPSSFIPQNVSLKKMKVPGGIGLIPKDPMDRVLDQDDVKDEEVPVTYTCERAFCVAEFPSHQQLQQHIASNTCYEACRNQPIGEYLRVRYFLHFGTMSHNTGRYLHWLTNVGKPM